jgi:hypothetical protein
MLTVKALRDVAASMTVEQFRARHGPAALIESPPEPALKRITMGMAGARTVGMAHRSRLAERLVAMLRGFDRLVVHFLAPGPKGVLFTVGRGDSCAVVVHDPSVSKHHATLSWDLAKHSCALKDEGSTNGTFAGTSPIGQEAHPLVDGDSLSFGDAHFMFVLADTLHAQLVASRG